MGATDNKRVDDVIETCERIGDLLDVLLAVRPHEVQVLGGVAEGLWGKHHPDKQLVFANLRAITEAIA